VLQAGSGAASSSDMGGATAWRKAATAALALSVFLSVAVAAPRAKAAAARTGQELYDEWDFVDRTNAARQASGLSSLGVVSSWRETARDHSETMAAAGSIFHDDGLSSDADHVSSCWSRIGENVGVGGSVADIQAAFMASSGHRANILTSDFRYIGVGVEWRNGRLWVTVRFMTLRSGCTLPTTPHPVFHWMDVSLTGSGDGTVTSSPTGVACGSDCREPYTAGTRVTLTATASEGSVFRGWSGGGCSGLSACTVTMDQARSVDALFVARHLLTITPAGSGTGTVTSSPPGIDCGAVCSETFDEGTTITLNAEPDLGSVFRGWSGGGCDESEECTVTIETDTSVTAIFVAQHDLETTLDGSGEGQVVSSPEGIDCGFECVAPFDEGSEVTLSAIADSGSVFGGWSGGGCSGTEDCVVTMSEPVQVTATFIALHDLDVARRGSGKGSVTSSPRGIRCGFDCSAPFEEGADVDLTARPARSSRFVRWRGACAGSGQVCSVTITRDLSTTAIFKRRR
jgi:uncharacterized protein YkwD